MYACTRETGAGFFGGVRGWENRPLTFATHPHAIREWLYASTILGDTRRSESLFAASNILCLAISERAGKHTLEAARIGSLYFVLDGYPAYQFGSPPSIATFATRLSAQPLRCPISPGSCRIVDTD